MLLSSINMHVAKLRFVCPSHAVRATVLAAAGAGARDVIVAAATAV